MTTVPALEDPVRRSQEAASGGFVLGEPSPLLTKSTDELQRIVDTDAARLNEFRFQEIQSQFKRQPDARPSARQAIAQAIATMPASELLRRHSEAFREMEARGRVMSMDRAAMEREAEFARLDEQHEANPARGFFADAFAGMVQGAEDLGLSVTNINAALLQAAGDVLPGSIGEALTFNAKRFAGFADNWRDRIMTGDENAFGSGGPDLLAEMNHRANSGSRGAWWGKIAYYSLPSGASALRGVAAARALTQSTMALFATQSAGQGIEKYRREEVMLGREPSAWRAIAVGIGYGATEVVTERLDAIKGIRGPWANLTTHGASRVAEALIKKDARAAAHYLLNSIGHMQAEALEEVVAGEFQALIDKGIGSGIYDRSWNDRISDYGGGFAGAFLMTAAGSFSHNYRTAMSQPHVASPAEVQEKLIDKFEEFAKTKDGEQSALVFAVRLAGRPLTAQQRTTLETAIRAAAERAGKPDVGESIIAGMARRSADAKPTQPAAPEVHVAEFNESLASMGVEQTVRLATVDDELQRKIDRLATVGIRAIPIESDAALPLPGFATSEPGTVLFQRGADEWAVMAHEIVHVFRAEHPEVYRELVQATGGAVLGYAAQYLDDLRARGFTEEAERLMLDPEALVEEGAARMVEQTARLGARLSTLETGVFERIQGAITRTFDKAGFNGPVAQAVTRAFGALHRGAATSKTGNNSRPGNVGVSEKSEQSNVSDEGVKTSKWERAGYFAVRPMPGDDQMLLPFDGELAAKVRLISDPKSPTDPLQLPPKTTAEAESTPSAWASAGQKIAELRKLVTDSFKSDSIAESNLKLELAGAIGAALPGKTGQAFANRILDAQSEAELRSLIRSAHAVYVERVSKQAVEETQAKFTANRQVDPNLITVMESTAAQLRSMQAEYDRASRSQRKAMLTALREQSKLTDEAAKAVLREERAIAKEREAEVKQGFAAERRAAKRTLEESKAEDRVRLEALRQGMLDRLEKTREAYRQKRDAVEAMQKQMVDVLTSALPKELQARFLKQVPKLKTEAQAQLLIDSAIVAMEAFRHREAVARAAEAIGKVDRRGLGPIEQSEFDALIAQLGIMPAALAKMTEDTREEALAVAEFKADNPDAPLTKARLRQIERLFATPLRELSVAQLDSVTKQCEAIFARWKRRSELLEDSRRTAVQKASQAVTDEFLRVRKGDETRTPTVLPLKTDALGRVQKAPPFVPGYREVATYFAFGCMSNPVSAKFAFGDEESLGYRTFVDSIEDGRARQMFQYHLSMDGLFDALSRQNRDPGSVDLALMSTFVSEALGGILQRGRTTVKPRLHSVRLESGASLTLTEAERIDLLGHFLDLDTVSLLLKGAQFRKDRDGVSVTLTAKDMQAIKESAGAEEKAISAYMYGEINGRVQNSLRHHSVSTYGYDITRKNYWSRQRFVEGRAEAPVPRFAQTYLGDAGVVQERVGGLAAPIRVRDAFAMFQNHVHTVAGIVHLENALDFARQVIGSQDFRDAEEKFARLKWREHFENMLEATAREALAMGPARRESPWFRAVDKLRRNTILGSLGLNPKVGLYNLLGGALLATTRISAMGMTKAIIQQQHFNLALDKEIKAAHPFLRDRMESGPFGRVSEIAEGGGAYGAKHRGALVMFMVRMADNMMIRDAWSASVEIAEKRLQASAADFNKATGQELQAPSKEAIHAEAARMMVDMLNRTQPTQSPAQQTGIGREARHDAGAAIASMFMGQQVKNVSMLADAALDSFRQPTPRNLARLSYNLAVVGAMQFMLIATIKHLFGLIGKDEEKTWLQRVRREAIVGNFGSLYGGRIAGEAFDAMLRQPGETGGDVSSTNPVADNFSSLFQGIVQAARNANPPVSRPAGVERAALSALTLAGVPVASPYRLLKKAFAGDNGSGSSPARRRGTAQRRQGASRR